MGEESKTKLRIYYSSVVRTYSYPILCTCWCPTPVKGYEVNLRLSFLHQSYFSNDIYRIFIPTCLMRTVWAGGIRPCSLRPYGILWFLKLKLTANEFVFCSQISVRCWSSRNKFCAVSRKAAYAQIQNHRFTALRCKSKQN